MQKEESKENYVTNLRIDGVSVGLPPAEQLIILPPQLVAAQDVSWWVTIKASLAP